MYPIHLSDDFFVGTQLEISDIQELVRLGFKSVICNREDYEDLEQPDHASLSTELGKVGIEYVYLPVNLNHIGVSEIDKFTKLDQTLTKPTYAYCRTGTRAATLWSLGMLKTMPLYEILSITRRAGFDLQKYL